MATLLPIAEQQFCDGNGAPLVDGKVWFYVPGTTTPKDTFQDPAGTILNTNPVVLDAAGRAVIFGTGSYRQVLKDADGDVIWDATTADTSSSAASWAGTSTGTGTNIVLTAPNFASADGQAVDFLLGVSISGPAQATVNGTAIPLKLDTLSGPVQTANGCAIEGNRMRVTYDATGGFLHLTPVVDRGFVDVGVAGAIASGNAAASAAQANAQSFATSAANQAQSNAISTAAQDATNKASAAQSAAQGFATNADATVLSNAESFATNADATVLSNAQSYANAQATAAKGYSDNQLAAAQSTNASTYVRGTRLSGIYSPGLPYSRSAGQVVVYVNFSPNNIEVAMLQANINGTWVTTTDA